MIAAYLTKRPNGAWLLTHGKPVIRNVGRSPRVDAYANPGDPLAFMMPICDWAVGRLFDIDAAGTPQLMPIAVELEGHAVRDLVDTT